MLSGKKLAITTGSMNRLGNLRKSLSTWLRLAEADHVIVVDWGSAIPVNTSIQINDPRLLVADAPEQSKWHHSRCHNLEFKLASMLGCELVLRLDNDCLVQPDFFARHPMMTAGEFYAVDCHRVPPEMDDKRNLCGTLFTNTNDFDRVGGYNERLVHYGYEDEDLYNRLRASGLRWLTCDLSSLEHLPHDDLTRFENLDIDLRKFRDTSKLKQFLIAKNHVASCTKPWTSSDRRSQWIIDSTNPRHWICLEAPKD